MLWNELDFEVQRVVLRKIICLIDDEGDPDIIDGLRSAFLELRMWSSFPCEVVDAEENYEDC